MWTEYFKMVNIRRGRVVTPSHGEIDFSRDDISVEICKELYESDFPYLDLTEKGRDMLYDVIEDKPEQLNAVEIGAETDLSETVEPEDSPPNRKRYSKRGSPK